MTALLIVDVQNDFLPGGALEVKQGDCVIPVINRLLESGKFDFVVASKDWHPKGHVSFAKTHHKNIGEVIELEGLQQTLWPMHCVQDSFGAEFPDALKTSKIEMIIYKGTELNIDSYSAFFDNGYKKSTGLGETLKEKGIKKLYVTGLATDYCVKFSVVDALKLNFDTYLIEDACFGVNLKEGDSERAIEVMKQAGAHSITSGKFLGF